MATTDSDSRNRLLKLLTDKTFTDYKIRMVYAPQGTTPPLRDCCSTPKLISWRNQKDDGTYSIADFSLPVVRCMVEYIYSGNYDVEKIRRQHNNEPDKKMFLSKLHVGVFAIAHEYMIPKLKKLALRRLFNLIPEMESTTFVHCVWDVYAVASNTSRQLRDVVLFYAVSTFKRRMLSPEVMDLLESAMSEYPEFASDLLAWHTSKHKPCLGCRTWMYLDGKACLKCLDAEKELRMKLGTDYLDSIARNGPAFNKK
ncbi:hypothetical protein E4U55_003495 [Claviceps digitariae]|nr:hypothetical protein E4U55_003495 [Claviceps digitariae]